MSDTDRAKTDPKGLLFDELDDAREGMLGIDGSGQHFQPMTHNVDREKEALYFITFRQADILKAIGSGAHAHFTVVGKNGDFHTCIRGHIAEVKDEAKLDELWNPINAAWFDEGRKDPDVVLLKMDLIDAALWASTSSTVWFGLQILKANLSKEAKPDIGTQATVTFARAA
jgi:general stress protein 26